MSCEIPAFGTETTKKIVARKDYTCCECGRKISKGNTYQYYEACWPSIDGWANFKMCLHCNKIRTLALSKYPPDYPEEGPPFGELYEYIREERQ